MGLYRGTLNDDVIFGGAGNDVLHGEAGSDSLSGNGGSDRIFGGAGADRLFGGTGDDILWGGDHADWMSGGAGNDLLRGGAGDDTIVASIGNDELIGETGTDTLTFAELAGTGSIKVVLPENSPENGRYSIGAATFGTIGGFEIIELRGSNDAAFGDEKNNTFYGLAGQDTLSGRGGHDVLYGGLGNDHLYGGLGNDILDGGAGKDTASFFGKTDMIVNLSLSVAIGDGSDRLIDIENVETEDGNDSITGNALDNQLRSGRGNDLIRGAGGNDTMNGAMGNDTLDGGRGADRMIGGSGNDAYFVDNAGDVIAETATEGQDRILSTISIDLQGQNGAFANVEDLLLRGTARLNGSGTSANNVLTGNSGANVLSGRDGNDVLSGGAGNDRLRGGNGSDRLLGGEGNDLLAGGGGRDSFEFNGQFGRDRIADFQDNLDSIRLLNLGVSSFAQARSHATQVGEDVVFNFGNGNVLTVEHTTINALSNDLIFV